MQTTRPDLFPETLLVSATGSHTFTTSLKVAEHFGKRHDDVLKVINAVVKRTSNPELLRNFAEQSEAYLLKGRLRQRPIYHLSRDGFVFIAMGFTGPQADEWKWDFLNAFNAMEAELHATTARYAAALDALDPALRPTVERTQQGHNRTAIAEVLGKSCGAVTYRRGKARRLGLLAARQTSTAGAAA